MATVIEAKETLDNQPGDKAAYRLLRKRQRKLQARDVPHPPTREELEDLFRP